MSDDRILLGCQDWGTYKWIMQKEEQKVETLGEVKELMLKGQRPTPVDKHILL